MPKSLVRAEIVVPEADVFFVERSLRDLFDTLGLGSVCAGGGTKSDPEDGISRGVSVMGEIFDPEGDSGCVRMPLGRSPE